MDHRLSDTNPGLKAIILPAITLGLYQMTLIMRLVRSEMLEVLRQDYIRFARARGLKRTRVNFRHALKNTLVPVITVTGLQLGSIIAFAIITETVFQWPGVGLLFINAIQFVDIPVMAAYLMLISVMFVGINLIVDLLYFAIDPAPAYHRTGPPLMTDATESTTDLSQPAAAQRPSRLAERVGLSDLAYSLAPLPGRPRFPRGDHADPDPGRRSSPR